MIRVTEVGAFLRLECNYAPDYVTRFRKILGSEFFKTPPHWLIPKIMYPALDDLFPGELVYITPHHEIAGEPAPHEPWYDDIVTQTITGIACELFPFQQFGASFLAQRTAEVGFAFLCDDTGVGKSPQALAALLLLQQTTEIKRTLVVTAASVKRQWVIDVIPKFLGPVDVVEVRGRPKKRQKQYQEPVAFTVVNYELIREDIELILKEKWDLVIWDECQYMRTNTGVTHRAGRRMGRRIPHQFFLTASVLMHDLEDLHALFSIADEGRLGTVAEFRQSYIRYDYSNLWPKLIGYRNLDELTSRVAPFILRRTDSDPEVAKYLPKIITQNHYVDMDTVQKALYEQLNPAWEAAKDDLIAAYQSKNMDLIRRADNRCRGIIVLKQGAANSPQLFTMSDSPMVKPYRDLCVNARVTPKMKLIKHLVSEFAAKGEKILIFTQFERMARLMHEYLADTNPALFAGTNKKVREDEKLRFLIDPACLTMVSTDAGGVGLNLQVARCLINIDLLWNPGQADQRKGRIRRMFATHRSILVLNIITRNSIDEQILETNTNRRGLFKTIIPELVRIPDLDTKKVS